MEVEVEQDFVPPANTPELPQPRKFSSPKIELLALQAPLGGSSVVHSAIIHKYGEQAGVLRVVCNGRQDKVGLLNKMVGVEAIWWRNHLKEV